MHSPSRSRAHSRSRASSRETSQRPRASSRETSQRPRGLSSPRERRPHGFSWPREHEISMSNVDFHLDAEEDSQVHSGQEQKLLADDQARLSIIGEEQLMSKFNIPEGYTLIDSRPYEWAPPADVANHPYKEHQGEGSQYLRDFILGINDGLISTLLLVVGMVGGGADSRAILLAAISAAIAGAIAMGLGEWIATKSQNDVVTGEMRLEKEHFKYHRGQEIDQLRTHLKTVGLDGALLEACVRQIASNDTYLMKIMERFEFGAENNEDNELTRSPVVAMFMSGRLFFLGALPSTLPFIQSSPELGLLLSCLACGITLFGVGVYKTRTTGGNPWYGGFENFMAGALGAGISFCVGLAYNAIRSA